MKKLTPSFIAITVCLSIYSTNNYADENKILKQFETQTNPRCLTNVPKSNLSDPQDNINDLPINVMSDSFKAELPNKAIYNGNVVVTQGNRQINSDQLTLIQSQNQNREIILNGNVSYQDNMIEMYGDKASMNLVNKEIQIDKSQYHLVNRLGRGSAESVQFTNNRYLIINEGSFTSCPVDNKSWNIEGSKIVHDNDEQLLEVWNAVFRIANVPVLYTPYLQLPTGNKRRSGLLMPDFSYNSIGGIDFSLPFYWNIAPNYDATFTPRIIQKRGIQLQTEARYLNALGYGTLAFDWLQHDKQYSNDRNQKHHSNDSGYSDNSYRWLFHWKNEEQINDNWRLAVNTTRVSDNQYITDLGSKYASETDGYLTQDYTIGYADEKWDVDLNYKYFQPLYDSLKHKLYRPEPQLNINYYDSVGDFNFKTFTQVSHFVTSGKENPKTWRFHFEPVVNYNIISSWASLSTEAGFLATRYNQDVPKSNQSKAYLKENTNRFLPKFSIDGKIIFERSINSFAGYTQTIEPRVKYLYIPYRNQSRIDNYDSSLLQSDYIGLFREQPFSGLDRIASANKLANGITTRVYDDNQVERFNLSFGQVYYFTRSKTGDNSSLLDQDKDTGTLTWAMDNFWRINDDMIFRSGVQYDTRINKVSLANAIYEYRISENKMTQLSYRYANKKYIDSIDTGTDKNPYKQNISQFGVMSSWPLTDSINAVGSVFYDIDNNQIADDFIGLRYEDCCWGVSLQYGRKIVDWNSDSKSSKYENKFSINFELRGLNQNRNTIAKMLDFGLLPYNTAFDENYGTK